MKLEKVLTYQKGKSPLKGFVSQKQILYLTPEYLRGNSAPNYISDFPGKVEVEDGDLLLLWDGSNAGEFFIGKNGVLSSTMVKFKFNLNDYNREFLFYQLKGIEGYLKSQTNGSGIPHVDRELLLKIKFSRFSSFEQIRIAEILSTADSAIGNTEALISKYQRIKTGLMQDLLTKGIDENGNIRSKSTHKFVVKNGIEVPDEWDVLELEKVCTKITDGSHFSPIPQEEGKLIGNVKDMCDDGFNLKSCTNILDKDFQVLKQQNCSPQKGDVLLSKDGTIGRVLFYDSDFEIVILSSIAILRPKSNIYGNFLSYLLKSSFFQTQLFALESGSALKRIVLKDIRSLKFPFPKNLQEQIEISIRLNKIENLIQIESNKLSKLNSIKTGLMQDLLSGRVRVKT